MAAEEPPDPRCIHDEVDVALSAAGLGAMVKSALDSADALSKLSERVGITVESLSLLMPAAELSGVSAEKFEGGLRRLAARMLEAATGSAEAARGFEALGVAFRNQDGSLRATDQVLLDLADRFKTMPDGAEKTARRPWARPLSRSVKRSVPAWPPPWKPCRATSRGPR